MVNPTKTCANSNDAIKSAITKPTVSQSLSRVAATRSCAEVRADQVILESALAKRGCEGFLVV